jgi:formate dehydrogenase major subunit
VPGLGTRLGRGGATTTLQDLANSDCVVIMGANMAENHPVGFRFVMQAKERGATLIHVDPRFSRTSAMCDLHAPLRAGSDVAFLGALINHVLGSERWQRDEFFQTYLRHYTNAATLVREDFQDVEELGGVFSGYDPEQRQYDMGSWQFAGQQPHPSPSGDPTSGRGERTQTAEPFGERLGRLTELPPQDPTLQDPRCVLQVLRRHYARYTPEMVERICGVPRELFLKVAEALLENSGRERTSAFCYAVAWTQHTTGTQMIAACAILQLLLGNIGRPGGGIMALRGHATIQGSTDIPTLYNLLPGYLAMPSSVRDHGSLAQYLAQEQPELGWWHNMPKYIVSLLKAWYGDAATPDNDFGYDLLPKIEDDYSFQRQLTMMRDGTMKGLFCMGQNPAVGGQNARLARAGLASLEWLVVRDIHEIETAAFWYDSPEVKKGELRPEQIKTEIFLLPASLTGEKAGSYTNTQRLVQWHDQAIEPPGECRSEGWFMLHLGRRLRELYRDDAGPLGRQIRALTWDYATHGPLDEPDLDAVVREISGYRLADGRPVQNFSELKDDGSTVCGCWIYSGLVDQDGHNQAKNRRGDDMAALGWGWSWPANRRILYNRASADPQGRPWSERKRWVWWDEAQRRWVGHDIPDFTVDKPPDYQPPPGASGIAAHAGDAPFIMMADGKGWLYSATGLRDGPLPTHYEPWETPVANVLYPDNPRSPVAVLLPRPDNLYHEIGDERFPHVLTTYRLTEHLTAGGMSRFVPWLAELQPAGFCEISPELAAELDIRNGDWVTISTLRGAIETRALVTLRIAPLRVDGRVIHQIGLPWHFGYEGLAQGAIANDLSALVEDPNSRIHEAKAFTCALRKGNGSLSTD